MADHAGEYPVFYYDLGSPEAYLAAERVFDVLPGIVEWEPVLMPPSGAFRCQTEQDIFLEQIERLAADRGMQRVRWPADWPTDSALAMRAATYAKQIGRTVAFSLAAFRQSFAAGRDLSEIDNVCLAAAACEMHPNAIIRAVELRSVIDQLEAATAAARAAGVLDVPAVRVGEEIFHGDDGLEAAAAALAAGAVRPAERA